jgi:hypothetical protein
MAPSLKDTFAFPCQITQGRANRLSQSCVFSGKWRIFHAQNIGLGAKITLKLRDPSCAVQSLVKWGLTARAGRAKRKHGFGNIDY